MGSAVMDGRWWPQWGMVLFPREILHTTRVGDTMWKWEDSVVLFGHDAALLGSLSISLCTGWIRWSYG